MYLLTRDQSGLYGLGFTLASDQPSVVRSEGDVYITQLDPTGDYQGTVGAPGVSSSWTSWLNKNASMVMIGAAAFLGLVLVKGRR